MNHWKRSIWFQLLLQAEAAARRFGFQVKAVDCDLAPDAHEHPLQPVYVWEQDKDSAHEKPKVLARLTEELALSSKELQATAVFAKPLAVVSEPHCGVCLLIAPATAKHDLHVVKHLLYLYLLPNSIRGCVQVHCCGVRLSAQTDVVIHHATVTFKAGQLDRYLQIWELRTTQSLQVLPDPSIDIPRAFGIYYDTLRPWMSQDERDAAEGQALVQFLAINILTDRPGWGVPVVLSDLTEAYVFQRGHGPTDIFYVQFKNLREVSVSSSVTATWQSCQES